MARIRNQRTVPLLLIAIAVVLVVARMVSHQMKSDEAEPQAQAASGEVQWVPLALAEAESRRTGKPVLYDFTAEWCGPCHRLDAAVFKNAKLAAMINESFVPVRVTDRVREDGRNRPEVDALQRRYGVRAFPTVVFADAAGNAKETIVGFPGAERFRRAMERAR